MASLSEEEKKKVRRGKITFSEAHDLFRTKKTEEFKDVLSGDKFMKELFETLTPIITTPFKSSSKRYYKALDRSVYKKKTRRRRRRLSNPPKPPKYKYY